MQRNFISSTEDDDGVDLDESRFIELSNIGNFIEYNAVLPKEWVEEYQLNHIAAIVIQKINNHIQADNDHQEILVSMADVTTMITFLHDDLCWWFRRLNHTKPNLADYHFTGNLLEYSFKWLIIAKAQND